MITMHKTGIDSAKVRARHERRAKRAVKVTTHMAPAGSMSECFRKHTRYEYADGSAYIVDGIGCGAAGIHRDWLAQCQEDFEGLADGEYTVEELCCFPIEFVFASSFNHVMNKELGWEAEVA